MNKKKINRISEPLEDIIENTTIDDELTDDSVIMNDLESSDDKSLTNILDDEDVDEDINSIESGEFDDDCLYKYIDKDSDDDNYTDSLEEEDDNKIDYIADKDRITKPYLTIYERVRLLGDRAKQLAGGAKPMIKNVDHLKPKEIAELEIENNIIPLIIERPLPNGKKERWKISELIKL